MSFPYLSLEFFSGSDWPPPTDGQSAGDRKKREEMKLKGNWRRRVIVRADESQVGQLGYWGRIYILFQTLLPKSLDLWPFYTPGEIQACLAYLMPHLWEYRYRKKAIFDFPKPIGFTAFSKMDAIFFQSPRQNQSAFPIWAKSIRASQTVLSCPELEL